jgi:hypothetical protein
MRELDGLATQKARLQGRNRSMHYQQTEAGDVLSRLFVGYVAPSNPRGASGELIDAEGVMKSADRKLTYSITIVIAVIALEVAWFLFVGPADHSPYYATECKSNCDIPWWASPEFWTAAFTAVLTGSTILLWLETKRLAEGADAQAEDTRQSLSIARQAADAAVAAQRPWLNLSIEVLSPITFDENGPNVPLGFHIHNLGNTPATNVQFWAYLLPESAEQKTTSLELGMGLANAFAEKMVSIDFGLTVFPGMAPRQEQTHRVEKPFFDAIIANWDERPKIGLILAVVINYRFVGGRGYTQCGFRIAGRNTGSETDAYLDTASTIYRDAVTCDRETLWDAAR